MAHLMLLFLSSVLLTLTAFHGTHAVTYTATNNVPGTPGGMKFNNDIGVEYSKSTLEAAAGFIWQTFRQTRVEDRKNVQAVNMFVDNIDRDGVAAIASNNEIHVSANYIASYSGDVKREITGVLYHESTHTWQWNGNGQAPSHVIEGIADYVRLKAGYIPSHWVGPGGGNRWDESYDKTARFFEYCESLKDGFVAELNGKMRSGYDDNFFVELLGKPVEQLFREYKAKYGQ